MWRGDINSGKSQGLARDPRRAKLSMIIDAGDQDRWVGVRCKTPRICSRVVKVPRQNFIICLKCVVDAEI